jgi:hypothetical protein
LKSSKVVDLYIKLISALMMTFSTKDYVLKQPDPISILESSYFIISDEFVPDIQGLTETELTATLANHLFGKLATTSNYVMDAKYAGRKMDQCFCGREGCILTGRYGDTSIGLCLEV